MTRTVSLLFTLVVAFASPSGWAQAPRYRIIDLSHLLPSDHQQSGAVAISDGGAVAGFYDDSGWANQAFFWSPATGVVLHSPLPRGADVVSVGGVNDDGLVVGSVVAPGPWGVDEQSGFWWRAGKELVEVPSPPGYVDLRLYRVNNAGTAVGFLTFDGLGKHNRIVTWTEAGGLVGGPDSAHNHLGTDINADGVMAGDLSVSTKGDPPAGSFRAAVFQQPDRHRSLGLLPGADGRSSYARAINDKGTVAVAATVYNPDDSFFHDAWRAAVWSRATGMRELPALQGTDECDVDDINNRDEVIGACWQANDTNPVFLPVYWSRDTGAKDIRDLIVPDDPLKPYLLDLSVRQISQAGHIAALAKLNLPPFRPYSAVVLVPVR